MLCKLYIKKARERKGGMKEGGRKIEREGKRKVGPRKQNKTLDQEILSIEQFRQISGMGPPR